VWIYWFVALPTRENVSRYLAEHLSFRSEALVVKKAADTKSQNGDWIIHMQVYRTAREQPDEHTLLISG
jgi:hypothetical protein